MNEHRFGNPAELAEKLATSVAGTLRQAIAARGAASLVVSGGSTPRPFFERLNRQDLDWEKVSITLADERWVDTEDEASNERLVRQTLLQNAAAAATFVGLKTDQETPEAGQATCEAALSALPLPFDVVVFGMGGDGHTASLFPEARRLAEGLDPENPALCLPIYPPAAPYPRMSLTASALIAGSRLILHITGENKWLVYQQALADGPETDLPVRAVLRRGTDRLDVYWAA